MITADGVLSVAMPVLGVIPLFGIHLAVYHWPGRRSLIQSFVIAFGATALAYLGIGVACLAGSAFSWEAVAGLAVDLTIFTGCAYVYIDVLNLGECSIRTRILDEIDHGPENGLTMSGLLRRYNARQVVDLRLGRMVDDGQLALGGNLVSLGPSRRFLWFGRTFRFLRGLLFGSSDLTSRSIRSDWADD